MRNGGRIQKGGGEEREKGKGKGKWKIKVSCMGGREGVVYVLL